MGKAPYYIKAAVDVHTLPKPELNEYTLQELLHDGLIEQTPNKMWITTPKGQAYVKLLGEVPLPTQKWADPRNG